MAHPIDPIAQRRPRKPILSIRARLVILALLAVVPLMLDRVRLLEATRIERIDDAATEALELARRGADGQREIITTATRHAAGDGARLCRHAGARRRPAISISPISPATCRGSTACRSPAPTAGIKCSTTPTAIGVDLSDRPHYRAAQETRDFVVSNYVIGRVNKRPAIVMAYPTQAIDQNVHATVLTSVDLQWVSGLIDSLERRPGSTVMLIDGSGTVLAGDKSAADCFGKRVERVETAARGRRPRRRHRARSKASTASAASSASCACPSSDARLLVGLNEAEVLAARRPRDHARLSAARLLRPAGADDRLVRRRAADRRSDPLAGAHRDAVRPRRSARARIRAEPGPRNSRRSPRRSTTWRRSSPSASTSCATPTGT